ncbi:Alpha/Beta hydrolase protein [Staphylotrichum tortipilum]|uniref:Alpha/Beta hydrolase protein n=1 Tax=Staphylotrichum tortipilum TaxID=2831512 RepID=A0AAN6RTI0_9PEZI|nr:Alpha/Beta hydrolase protein [Staphylotrichum longicolle]
MSKARTRAPSPPSTMASTLAPILVPSLLVGLPLGLYSLFLGLSAIPSFQRNFLYAHKIHTLWWKDIDEPEQWGFAKNQVTPFHLTTSDNETLYAWHILPLPLYAQHEASLSSQPSGPVPDITATENFRLLRDDPAAKLIISFHGNAAQLSQGIRPRHYHSLTSLHSRYHLLTLDYRGFGLSTGSPTEEGLIRDAVAAITWAVNTAGVSPDRIVLVGHSLGTAVVAAAVEEFTGKRGWNFAGVVCVAGFRSLPEMLAGYKIGGVVPALRPVGWWPWLREVAMGCVVDKWESAARWRGVVRAVKERRGRLRLSLVHARDDGDIPWREDNGVFRAAVEGLVGEGVGEEEFEVAKKRGMVVRGKGSFVATWREGDVEIRQELVPHGGHNSVLAHAPVVTAVMRAFGLDEETVV